jgi:hypothetical protein
MLVLNMPVITERRPGPYKRERSCRRCGASPLSSYNPSDICAPCAGGDWVSPEASEDEIAQLRQERLEEIGAAAA